MIPKFAASDDFKISQVEVTSEYKGSLSLSICMRLTILFL